MNRPRARTWALILLLAVLLLAASRFERADSAIAPIAEAAKPARPRPAAMHAQKTAVAERLQLQRAAKTEAANDLFQSKSWYVAPPPPVVAAAAEPAPTAPPLPFTYLGSYEEAGKPVYFLISGGRVFAVNPGDVVEHDYRIDGVSDSAIELTYLPLDIRQTLEIGAAG